MGPKIGASTDTNLSKLILSRAGLTPALDKINLEKSKPVRVSEIRMKPVVGSGDKARVKAVRRTTFMQVVPTDRPTFVQVLPPERLIPFEATAGGPAIRKATGLLPLLSGRPEPPALVDSHFRLSTHRPTPAAGV